MSGRLTAAWLGLPGETRSRLLLGSTGPLHLAEAGLAGRAPGASGAAAGTCADILLCACAESPLDGRLALEVLDSGLAPLLLPQARATLQAAAGCWRHPGGLAYLDNLIERRDTAKLRAFLDGQIRKEPDNLFWRHQAAALGLFEAEFEWVAAQLDVPLPDALAPCVAALRGQLALLAGRAGEACAHFQETAEAFGPGFALSRQGQATLAAGRRDEALRLLLRALAASPWQTSTALKAFDLLHGRDLERAPLPGSVAVLLYSWNKAEELDATLEALHASDLARAKIFVLDNGSTDHTARTLTAWAERFGQERLERIDLPVNVGAPAARNWLMRLPEVGAFDFCAYLDDDALVPPDWLALFGAAVRRYPDSGVWGCKVVDFAAPARIQSADLHLTLPLDADPQASGFRLDRLAPNPFRLSDLHIQTLDLGQFDFVRPCASVTGCCHLFRTQVLLESGDFAINLSPSQYDDVEHDLKLLAAGRFAAYQGHLAVRHRKRTGAAGRTSKSEEANALGNKYKMQVMHPPQEIRAGLAAERRLLEEDLLAKLGAIDETLE